MDVFIGFSNINSDINEKLMATIDDKTVKLYWPFMALFLRKSKSPSHLFVKIHKTYYSFHLTIMFCVIKKYNFKWKTFIIIKKQNTKYQFLHIIYNNESNTELLFNF